jgi:hypothetical protein
MKWPVASKLEKFENDWSRIMGPPGYLFFKFPWFKARGFRSLIPIMFHDKS